MACAPILHQYVLSKRTDKVSNKYGKEIVYRKRNGVPKQNGSGMIYLQVEATLVLKNSDFHRRRALHIGI